MSACWIQYLDASGVTPTLLWPVQYGACPAPENVTSPSALEAATVTAYAPPPPCPASVDPMGTGSILPDFLLGSAADTSMPAGAGSSTNVTFFANFTVRVTSEMDSSSSGSGSGGTGTIRSVQSVCLANATPADEVVPNAWLVAMASDVPDLFGAACFLLWRDPDATGTPLGTLRQYWSVDAGSGQAVAACPASLSGSAHKDLLYLDGLGPAAAPPSPTPIPSYSPAATATPSPPPAAATASPVASSSPMPSPAPGGEPAFPYACPAGSGSGSGLISPQYHASFAGSGATWHVGEAALLFVPASGAMLQTFCVAAVAGPSTITPEPSSGLGPSPYTALIITTNNEPGLAQDFCVVMVLTPGGEPANLFAPGPTFCTAAALASFPGSPEAQSVGAYSPPNATSCALGMDSMAMTDGDLPALPAYLIGTAVQDVSVWQAPHDMMTML